MQPKKVFAHYMVCNRDYGSSVSGYGRDIADAQAMGFDGFALNIGAWNSTTNYMGDTALMFAAAAQNAAAQSASANPLPPFMLFLSADMTGLDYPSIVAFMTQYSAHPNYAKMQVVNTAGVTEARPILSTWGGEGGAFDGATTDAVKPRWHQTVLDVLKTANINVFFMPRLFVNWTPSNVAALAVGFADGLYIQSSLASIPPVGNQIDIVADLNTQLAAAKAAGLFTMGSVSPQYWGSKQTSNGRMYYEFNGSVGLHAQFIGLINNSNCDWIECFTWNDFDEATYLSPIDDVNKYWPYCQNSTANFYKQRNGYKNEIPFYIKWFKTGTMPAIAQNEIIGYHRTMPNNLRLADPIGVVYSGQWNTNTNAPDATDQIVFTTKLPAPATIFYTGGVPAQTQSANVLAGLQHTTFPFAVGPHTVSLTRNNAAFLNLTLEPIVNTITPPSYNFNYASAAAVSPYITGATILDYDIATSQALTEITENLNSIASGTDGYIHAQVSCSASDTKVPVDVTSFTPSACLVPLGGVFNPVANQSLLLPATWLKRGVSSFVSLAVGPHASVSPVPGQYKLYWQISANGQTLGGYATGSVLFL